MIDMLSGYVKYVISNKKEGFALVALCCAIMGVYLTTPWDTNPALAWISLLSALSVMVRRITMGMKKMLQKSDADN